MYRPAIKRISLPAVFTLFLLAMVSNIAFAAAPVLTIPTTSVDYEINPVIIAADLAITDGGDPIDGATVTINNNFVAAEDQLQIAGATNGTSGAISYAYNSTTGVLTFTGSDTATNYQALLRQVAYTNLSGTPTVQVRQLVFTLGSTLNNPDNGHYYEFVVADDIDWADARAGAEALNYYGLQGYLTTVTSQAENDFISSKLQGKGWMGASDDNAYTGSTETHWYWVTGPEAGTEFCFGGEDTCLPQNGAYINWAAGEPNHWGATGENFGHFLEWGEWNDYAFDNNNIVGYVVEYGGMAGDPVLQLSDSVSVNVQDSSADPDAPVLTNIVTQTGLADAVLTFTATATDANNDALTFSLAAGAPAGAAIDATTGQFTWTPDVHGIYTFTVVVTDTTSLTDEQLVTAVISAELVQNGDLEAVDAVTNNPTNWTTGHLDKGEGKRKCDDTPNCYFLFKPIRDTLKTKLKQVVDENLTATLQTGETLTLSVDVAPKKAKGKFAVAKVFYTDPNLGKDYIRIKLPASGSFQTVVSEPLTLKGSVERVRVILSYKKTAGKYKADNISLIVAPTGAPTLKANTKQDLIPLPLPEVASAAASNSSLTGNK